MKKRFTEKKEGKNEGKECRSEKKLEDLALQASKLNENPRRTKILKILNLNLSNISYSEGGNSSGRRNGGRKKAKEKTLISTTNLSAVCARLAHACSEKGKPNSNHDHGIQRRSKSCLAVNSEYSRGASVPFAGVALSSAPKGPRGCLSFAFY